tara:strand:- start:40 stop:369 length:330 start_codon:yes stop_codon:yes gene_type:complete
MDFDTGRPDHIEDYIVGLKTGCWFEWTDPNNKIYANLNIVDGSTKPTETECTDGLAAMQAAWDLENDSYKSKRRAEYPDMPSQLDDIYHNGIDGWKASIKAIKDKYPKS